MAISATFMFALLKLQILLTKKNPSVTKFLNEGALSMDDNFDLYDSDFMIAFTLIDGIAETAMLDKRFIKWQAAYYTFESGKLVDWFPVDFYKCKDEDFAKFHEPSASTKGRFNKYRDNDYMYCIDWDKEKLSLYGDA